MVLQDSKIGCVIAVIAAETVYWRFPWGGGEGLLYEGEPQYNLIS